MDLSKVPLQDLLKELKKRKLARELMFHIELELRNNGDNPDIR